MNRACLVFASALLTLAASPATAHEHGEQWILADEYPAASLPGEGDEIFARAVADATQGRISIVTMPDAKMGFRSREHLQAVATGKVAMANTFSGAIALAEPVFGLPTMPFVVPDIAAARALYDSARAAYEAAFARHNQKLLWSTPWPPTGLWTRGPVDSVDAIAKLRVRAYDEPGVAVFTRLGANAAVVSFSDLGPRLESGDIDAVLSSGDAAAGARLRQRLPHFTAIQYAIPLSFTTVNLDRWNALDEATRKAIEGAAARTEARQWQAVEGRVAKNYERMRAEGVTIVETVSPALRLRLREAARGAIDDWSRKLTPDVRALVRP